MKRYLVGLNERSLVYMAQRRAAGTVLSMTLRWLRLEEARNRVMRWRGSAKAALARELREELKGSILQLMEREAHWKRVCDVRQRELGRAEAHLQGVKRLRGVFAVWDSAMVARVVGVWQQGCALARVWAERDEAVTLLQALHHDHQRLSQVLELSRGLSETEIANQTQGLAADLDTMAAKSELREREHQIVELRQALEASESERRITEKQLRAAESRIEGMANAVEDARRWKELCEQREVEAVELKQALAASQSAVGLHEAELLAATNRAGLLEDKVVEMEAHRDKLKRMEHSMQLLQLQLQMTEGSKQSDLEIECEGLRESLRQRERELVTAMALADAAWSRAVPVATSPELHESRLESRLDGTSLFGRDETRRVGLATASALLGP